MNTNKSQDNRKTVISSKDHPKKPEQSKNGVSGDIHKVIDGQVVPTRAPSEVERDISPGTPTRSL